MVKHFTPIVCLLISLTLSYSANAEQNRQDIRFYKANRQLQSTKLILSRKKTRSPGCHNFIKKTRVYRLNQVGYKYCQAFTRKNCQAGFEVSASHKKDPSPTTKFSQGVSWFIQSEHKRGERVKSWSCQPN